MSEDRDGDGDEEPAVYSSTQRGGGSPNLDVTRCKAGAGRPSLPLTYLQIGMFFRRSTAGFSAHPA